MKKKSTFCFFIIFCIFFFQLQPLWGQQNKKMSLQIKNRSIHFSTDLNNLSEQTASLSEHDGKLYFLRFSAFPASELQNKTSLPFKKLDFVGSHTFLCYLSQPLSKQQLEALGINGFAALIPDDKLSPILRDLPEDAEQQLSILIQLIPGYTPTQLQTILNKTKSELSTHQMWKKKNILQINVIANQLQQLISSPLITYIQPVFQPTNLNSLAVGYTNAAIAHQPVAMGGYGLLGDGITIGIGDDANPHHIDYNDRLTSFSPTAGNDHGNHTTGTVGGNGIKDQRYRGFAPHASLIADFYSQIIANASIYYDNFNMLTTNNSYAMIVGDCNYAGTYDIYSNYLDQQAIDLPHLLNCFAAGNDGALSCSPFPTSYGTVVGAYSTAKNVLCVGAIGHTRDIEFYKFSRGPVKDGRLKPEITGMGYKLTSTGPDNGYKINSGTSMSTPNVTGSAALLYERYRQLHSNQDADNALIKLLLMNGADDIAEPGPDFHYGFGLLNTGRSLTMLNNNHFFSGILQTGQQQNFSFQIPANTATAKIMLYWNDPAASPMATKELVNDLDLTVENSAGINTFPLVLNPSPSQVSTPATAGEDHTNNVEQVTLHNPSAGNYTIHVKGLNIPQGPQTYYVAYSFIPNGITFQYPVGGEAFIAGDSTYIYWQAPKGNAPFVLSFSSDNGNNWQVLNSNLAADKRAFLWHIPQNVPSANCRIKITRGSETIISQQFVITGRPEINFDSSSNQCPGSARFSWHPIPGINKYCIFKKSGVDMAAVDSTTDTIFTINGLVPDSTYWIAVAPIINNKIGIRSVAKAYTPNQGNCSEVTMHGDLRLVSILAPKSGRKFTQSALSTNTPFKITVQNLDNQAASGYTISWQINNQPWQQQSFQQSIPPSGIATLNLPALNMADAGNYILKVAVTNQNINDPVSVNDTLEAEVRQLKNDPMDLTTTYDDGFEQFPQLTVLGTNKMGVGNSNHWDFSTNGAHGRLRSFLNSGITIQGSRSVSLDNSINQRGDIAASSQNYFNGTFNLSQYNANNTEIRCSFEYFMSGVPKFDTGNQVWVRGDENQPWQPLYTYEIDTNNLGAIFTSGSLSLSDVLTADGQNFSTATQIRFGQRDTSLIESSYYGNGFTMDNFSLYMVHDDIQLLAIDSLFHFNCALSNQVPLKTTIYNSVQNTVYHIPVTFQLDNQTPVTEIIDSIIGKDTIQYQFQTTMDLSLNGEHALSVWTAAAADSYRLNDSIINYVFHNQPVIDSFPYLQDFEQGNGHFYAEGMNSSWQYGTPASPHINHAASGKKAWKTNLSGSYNDNELSYLYSPCFDISDLQNPVLSFSLASDIEFNPNHSGIYDLAYMEYSSDGIHWERLGAYNQGYNWYNNHYGNGWAIQGETWWHVATIPLPQTGGNIAFRFVLKTDPGATFEGLAIDDIHIYDLQKPIFNKDSLEAPMSKHIVAGSETEYAPNEQLLAIINSFSNTLNNTSVQRFHHQHFINADSSQYFLPESFVIKSGNVLNDSVGLRLYVLDDAMKMIRSDSSCPSCAQIDEIYQMGITQYSDPDKIIENSSLKDNRNGNWNFIPYQEIRYVPYDKGYEIRVKVNHFSEIWFNSGGPEGNASLNEHLFEFTATHAGKRAAKLKWFSKTDAHTIQYLVQRTDSNLSFQTIGAVAPVGQNGHTYTFLDTPVLYKPFARYRILYQNEDGRYYSSPIRRLDWAASPGSVWVYPNPVQGGRFRIGWFKGNDEPLQWQFFDLSGRLIRSGVAGGNPYNDVQDLYPGNWGLSEGVYILKAFTKEHDWSFKIVFRQ